MVGFAYGPHQLRQQTELAPEGAVNQDYFLGVRTAGLIARVNMTYSFVVSCVSARPIRA
ncbi:hypothetical protein F4554_003907 [Actinopolymorpha rutila]|uniref:Uncharacterized protein n=1 Tax=Actinopolymorpha rutila TaxID=446787 RepID=A0A852ZP66_9ACTN|nr:hypothetical protein [Actinopolymorpha rutila]